MCQCQYNARGFLEIECFERVEDATEAAHRIEQSPERHVWQPEGGARFEGHDAEGLAIYSNVSI